MGARGRSNTGAAHRWTQEAANPVISGFSKPSPIRWSERVSAASPVFAVFSPRFTRRLRIAEIGQSVYVLTQGKGHLPDSNTVRSCSRCPLRRLLSWRERDQRNANDNKCGYVAQQMSAFHRILECLCSHNRGMNPPQPCCESNEAPILRRITRREQ